jgi:RNA polymerase sigma-70 factor, ECF subfamily
VTTDEALTRLARNDASRVIAILARRFGSLDSADECVQEALAEAARRWPGDGVPTNPPAWLLTVARNRMIDRHRQQATEKRRLRRSAHELTATHSSDTANDTGNDPSFTDTMLDEPDDPRAVDGDEDQLRLVLLCCHPALDSDAQVALTLRLVGGLTTDEIAAALLIAEPTLAQRIVRAKRKIRDANIPLSLPDRLDDRLDVVLGILFLIFNEGYLARGDTDHLVRVNLAHESIRLTRLVSTLVPHSAEALGLLALQLFAHSRSATRVDAFGELVLLDRQDRGAWNREMITEANGVLHAAMAKQHPGALQVQALIAAYHANAATAGDTDWCTIAALYAQLSAMTSSPVVALNHAVAVAMTDGPNAGLSMLDRLEGLDRYHLFHAARGELLQRSGDPAGAATALRTALRLTSNHTEQRHLERRITELSAGRQSS